MTSFIANEGHQICWLLKALGGLLFGKTGVMRLGMPGCIGFAGVLHQPLSELWRGTGVDSIDIRWYQVVSFFLIVTPTWGDDPIWLIFLKWVETWKPPTSYKSAIPIFPWIWKRPGQTCKAFRKIVSLSDTKSQLITLRPLASRWSYSPQANPVTIHVVVDFN